MPCLRFFSFILVVGLCSSEPALIRQQLSFTTYEDRFFPRELETKNLKTITGEQYNYGPVEQPLSKNRCPCYQTKYSLIGINQTPSQDDPTVSTTRRKTLIVWMKSMLYNTRGLTVYRSGKLIYRTDNYEDKKHSKEILLKNADGEVIFTISRKSHMLGFSFEGRRESGTIDLIGKDHSFKVHRVLCNYLNPRKDSHIWEVVYNDNRYSLVPSINDKSSNVNMEFKIVNAEGKTIAELKPKRFDGRGIPLWEDMFKLEVEAVADISFVVALVTVFGMINHKI